MSQPTTPGRVYDHHNECVGCGAHLAEPCHPACPFETGQFGPAVILRAAAGRLREHPAGVGYDIGAALWAVAVDLVGEDAADAVVDAARNALADVLVRQWGAGAAAIRTDVVYRHGLFTDLDEIGRSLYAAAAELDGVGFDPDTFGQLPLRQHEQHSRTGAPVDLRVGDRITVLAGKAYSGHTRTKLNRAFAIEVFSVRAEPAGQLEVTGFLLTSRGAWRAGVPTRSVILPRGSYTTPIRVGDTVRYRPTGEKPVVTAIHQRPDGTALADLLFRSGTSGSGYYLVDLEHLTRPAVEPVEQPCRRRHDLALRCARCVEANEPVTCGCDAMLCSARAVNLIRWTPPSSGPKVKALCPDHLDTYRHLAREHDPQILPISEGTFTYQVDGSGTQVATCRHCGHLIYLYPALIGQRRPWRGGEYDETGRCPLGEQRSAVPVRHEPATTLAERDYAHAAAACGTTANLHPLTDCPIWH